MPKRVLDFDAIWASDKLASCAPWARAEYAWIYGLADCNGSFELTNQRVIFGRVYAIRDDISLDQLSRVLEEFHSKGLLFVWEENGKRYGHWTGSDVRFRLGGTGSGPASVALEAVGARGVDLRDDGCGAIRPGRGV